MTHPFLYHTFQPFFFFTFPQKTHKIVDLTSMITFSNLLLILISKRSELVDKWIESIWESRAHAYFGVTLSRQMLCMKLFKHNDAQLIRSHCSHTPFVRACTHFFFVMHACMLKFSLFRRRSSWRKNERLCV